MRTLVTAKQMKAIDAYTINTIGVPSMVLMERAAMWVARAVEETAGKADVIWAVCGTGNNGADGVAAARMLHLKGSGPWDCGISGPVRHCPEPGNADEAVAGSGGRGLRCFDRCGIRRWTEPPH